LVTYRTGYGGALPKRGNGNSCVFAEKAARCVGYLQRRPRRFRDAVAMAEEFDILAAEYEARKSGETVD
jgi:hypothetical protein